jgi:hypothetical protein
MFRSYILWRCEVTLTPEQQAALEDFETKAQVARDAAQAHENADEALVEAEAAAEVDAALDLEAHQTALEAAQKFINLMLDVPTPTPPAGANPPKPAGANPPKPAGGKHSPG